MANNASLINIGSNLVWYKNANNDAYITNGNVGIGKSAGISSGLDVVGNINFTGNINSVTSTQLNYVSGVTNPIQTQFAGTSNYVFNTSNAISDRVTNYILSDFINMGGVSSSSNIQTSNYIVNTSNAISNRVTNIRSSQWTSDSDLIYFNSGRVGIGLTNPQIAYNLDVNGGVRMVGNTIMLGRVIINDLTDGGSQRGIFLWGIADTSRGIYMAQSGATKSLAGASACVGAGGVTTHALRLRTGNSSTEGLIYENSAENCLFSVRGNDGLAYHAGNVGIANTNPQYKLDVIGDINYTGTLRQNGTDIGAISTNKYFYKLNNDVSDTFCTNYINYLASLNSFSKIKGSLLSTNISHSNMMLYDDKGYYSVKHTLSGYSYQSSINNIVNIVCSEYHTVFLENTGKVLACGTGTYGSLGNGVASIKVYPTYVININSTGYLTNIVNIVCSAYHTVFLENTGKVLVCGYNNVNSSGIGILGDNTSTQRILPVYIVGVGGSGQLTNIVKIVCSGYHTVYLENTGKVLACGYNTGNGYVGDGTSVTKIYPVYVVNTSGTAGTYITNIVNIVCSNYHNVYLENTGKVLACGYNGSSATYGFIGDGTSVAKTYPVYVVNTSGTAGTYITNIVNIVCSNYHTVYLENTGKVLACGLNTNSTSGSTPYGIIGNGSYNPKTYPVYVVGVSGTGQLTNIINIVCSNYHTLYLENTGKVLACGNNGYNAYGYLQYGIFGDGTITVRYSPVYVVGIDGTGQLTNIVNIFCSIYTSIYLDNTGSVFACGYNTFGTVGDGSSAYTPYYPVSIGIKNIINIFCSDYNTGYLENSGKVLACGNNGGNGNTTRGIVGNGTTLVTILAPVYVITINTVTKIQYADKLSASYITNNTNNFTFLNNINTLQYNNSSVITSNIPLSTNFPVNISYPYFKDSTGLANLTNIIKIDSGYQHIIFLNSSGNVYGVGNNFYGQLGVNVTGSNLYSLPVQMIGASSIADIACGLYHTVLLTSTNTVLATGYNNYGQLGAGNTTNVNIATAMLNNTYTNQISCGEYHTLLKKTTNVVLATGFNLYGHLGVNSSLTYKSTPEQVKDVAGTGFLSNITKIGAGKNHSMFLSSSGILYGCGKNNLGQIGAPLTTTSSVLPIVSSFITYDTSGNIYSQSISGPVYDIYTNLRMDSTFVLM